MARRRKTQKSGDWLFPNVTADESEEQSSLLDVLDNVLNRGAVLSGDVVLGVANVDLIYVKLSVSACGARQGDEGRSDIQAGRRRTQRRPRQRFTKAKARERPTRVLEASCLGAHPSFVVVRYRSCTAPCMTNTKTLQRNRIPIRATASRRTKRPRRQPMNRGRCLFRTRP